MKRSHSVYYIAIALLIAVSLIFSGCNGRSPSISARDLMQQVEAAEWPDTADLPDSAFIESAAAFSWHLINLAGRNDADENKMISPASVYLALAMTLNGADGETKADMMETLAAEFETADAFNQAARNWLIHLQRQTEDASLHISNAIWYHDEFEADPDFLQTNADYFDADAHQTDFSESQAADLINDWVSEKTEGKIDSIVDSIDPDTVMFLINAIYFNADWQNPFEAELTRDRSFYAADAQIETPFMHRMGATDYLQMETAEGVMLPYADNRFGFVALLPDDALSAEELLQQLDQPKLKQLLENRETKMTDLALPKFESEYETSLKDTLTQLGLSQMFNPAAADFSLMQPSRQKNLYVEDVKHKTYIRVDEKGTEAAAVTSVEMRVTSAPETDHILVFDKPFVYLIIDLDTQLPLFAGTMNKP